MQSRCEQNKYDDENKQQKCSRPIISIHRTEIVLRKLRKEANVDTRGTKTNEYGLWESKQATGGVR